MCIMGPAWQKSVLLVLCVSGDKGQWCRVLSYRVITMIYGLCTNTTCGHIIIYKCNDKILCCYHLTVICNLFLI